MSDPDRDVDAVQMTHYVGDDCEGGHRAPDALVGRLNDVLMPKTMWVEGKMVVPPSEYILVSRAFLNDVRDRITDLTRERDALRKTLADVASTDPLAAHAEADHAMAYESNAELVTLRSRVERLERVAEAARAWYERRVVRDDDERTGRHSLTVRQFEEAELFDAVADLNLADSQQGKPK